MTAPGDEVVHVEVQGRSLVGEFEQLGRPGVRRRVVQDVGERHAREHPTPALLTRRHRGGLEAVDDPEERRGLLVVKDDLVAFVVEERERLAGHTPNVLPT